MASDPLAAIALIGLGVRSLSVAPAAVKPIRDLAASLDAGEAERLVDDLIDSEEHSVRDQVRDFAETARLPIDDQY
jgi:phosphotransferase system enzyme I (PtsP)